MDNAQDARIDGLVQQIIALKGVVHDKTYLSKTQGYDCSLPEENTFIRYWSNGSTMIWHDRLLFYRSIEKKTACRQWTDEEEKECAKRQSIVVESLTAAIGRLRPSSAAA